MAAPGMAHLRGLIAVLISPPTNDYNIIIITKAGRRV